MTGVKNERGFSLPEVMIATLLLTVGLLGTAEFLAISLRMHQLAQVSTEATRHAQAKVDELMKADFSTTPAIQITVGDSLGGNVPNYFDVPAAGFTRRWRVEAGPGANPQLRKLTVRVIPAMADRRTATDVRLTSLGRSW